MLELIISILISLNLNFKMNDRGQLEIDQNSLNSVESSAQFQEAGGYIPTESIVINDGADPNSSEGSNE